jgi:hypothetical protein
VTIDLRVHVREKIVTTALLAMAHAAMRVQHLVRVTVQTAVVQIAPVEIVPAMAVTNDQHVPASIVTTVPLAHVTTAMTVPHVPVTIVMTAQHVLAMTATTVQADHATRTKNVPPIAAVQTSIPTNQKRVDSLLLKMSFWNVLKLKRLWSAMSLVKPSLI